MSAAGRSGVTLAGPDGLLGFRAVADLRTTDGRRIRSGLLYRSATPQFTSVDDARRFADDADLQTIIDLRLPHEAQQEGSGGFSDTGVTIVNVPFAIRRTVEATSAVAPMTSPDPLVGTYIGYLGDRNALRTVVEQLSTPGRLPAMIHCTVGKDRTGVAVAIVLDALGVLRSDIVANYVARGDDVGTMMRKLRDMASYGDAVDVYPPEAYTSVAATMLRFLGWVDLQHGGARRYLEASGVTGSQLDALADRLLIPDGGTTMSQISHSIVLNASADDVWKVVGDVANVHAWVPALSATRMDGDVRVATFVDGGEARERIVAHSDADRSYTYTYLDGPIPLDQYESTLTVGPHHKGEGSLVTWTATVEAEPEVVESIDGLYVSGLEALKALID